MKMHSLETLGRMNEFACLPTFNHPRLNDLNYAVRRLPIGGLYRAALLRSIDRYADQFIDRPDYAPDEGWDDLEALQQVTASSVAAISSVCASAIFRMEIRCSPVPWLSREKRSDRCSLN
jgi:hypothetical protein